MDTYVILKINGEDFGTFSTVKAAMAERDISAKDKNWEIILCTSLAAGYDSVEFEIAQ